MKRLWLGLGIPALVLFVPVLLTVLMATFVLSTATGSRWSLEIADRWVEPLDIGSVEGSWTQGLSITELQWRGDELRVALDDLQLRLAAASLLRGVLRIDPLTAGTVDIELPPPAPPTGSEPAPIELPAVSLPLGVELPAVTVATLTVRGAEDTTQLERISLNARMTGSVVNVSHLSFHAQDGDLEARGRVTLHGDYPLQLRAALTHPQLPGTLRARAGGSLAQLQLHAHTSGEWPLRLEGELAPLEPRLPLRATLVNSEAFAVEIEGESLNIDDFTLELAGDLESLSGQLRGRVRERRFDASTLHATFHWQPERFELEQLSWQRDGAVPLQARCTVGLDVLNWQCDGRVRELPLEPLVARDAEISTRFLVSGSWTGKLALDLQLRDISGRLEQEAITGQAHLITEDGEQWRLPELQLHSGGTRLTGSGELGRNNQLQLRLEAEQLAHLYPPLQGNATARITISGGRYPDITANLDARELVYQEFELNRLEADAEVRELGRGSSRVQLRAEELLGTGLPGIDANLALRGHREHQEFQLHAALPAGDNMQLRCTNTLSDELQRVALDCAEFSGQTTRGPREIAWQLRQPLQLAWHRGEDDLAVQPFCLQTGDSSLCLQDTLHYRAGELHPFRASLDRLPLYWANPYLAGLQLEENALASARLDVQQLQPLAAQAQLRVPHASWIWQVDDEQPARASIEDFHLDLHAEDSRARLSASTRSESLGRIRLALSIDDPAEERRLDGQLLLSELQLGAFAWAAPQLNTLHGQIDSQLNLAGTLQSPTIQGNLQLREGLVEAPQLPQPVEDISLDADFDSEEARFTGGFMVGGGSGQLEGKARLPAANRPWELQTRLRADTVQFSPMPDSQVTLSSQLALGLTPGNIRLRGSVDVDRADIQLRELPPEAQRVSADAERVDVDPLGVPWQSELELDINLGERFRFNGFGADVRLAGQLQLRQRPGRDLRTTGEVRVPEGRYRAYGQRLRIRRGSFLFSGPIDNPDLNLEAIRDMPPDSDLVVGVRVSGALQAPSAELFSEPPRPETETAYLLLTGRPPDQFGQATQMSAEAALLNIGLMGSAERAARVAERIGIQDLRIATVAGEEGTEAQVSGYLSPRLYVRYGSTINQQEGGSTTTFQYRLTQQLLLEAVSGLNQGLDLLYSFSYDGRRDTRRAEEQWRDDE